MYIFNLLIVFCWATFLAYWAISAIGVKKNVKSSSLWKNISIRVGLAIIIILLVRTPFVVGFFQSMGVGTNPPPNFIFGCIGVALAAIGIGFAVWARVHLGKNWGMPMSIKEKPDLITSGPYAYVRHPIYTGILTALLGSVCANGLFWLIPFIIFSFYFLYSINEEEKLMTKQFANKYTEYKKQTKALVPFIW